MNRRRFFRFLAAAPVAIAAGPVLAAIPAKRAMTLAELRVSAEMSPDAYLTAIIEKNNKTLRAAIFAEMDARRYDPRIR